MSGGDRVIAKIQITLEAARRNIGYTQQEAAKLFGVHYQTLAGWEKITRICQPVLSKKSLIFIIFLKKLFFWK